MDHSVEVARKDAREFAENIFEYHHILEQKVSRYGAIIQKRWMKWLKKNPLRARKLLLEAWPNMAEHHRPDLEEWQRAQVSSSKKSRSSPEALQRREAYLWPYINLEDLMKPRTLLTLLHFRGQNQPDEFIYADMELAPLSHPGAGGLLDPSILQPYVMYFRGRTSPDFYGELVEWRDDANAQAAFMNGTALCVGYGMHALEIQSRILGFCVKVCNLIMHDNPSPTGIIKPNLELPPVGDAENYRSLGELNLEARYGMPAHLDLDLLEALISGQRTDREDHIWAMRENPRYFAERMTNALNHCRLAMLDAVTSAPHPHFLEDGAPKLFRDVAQDEISESYVEFFLFDNLLRLVKKLRSTCDKHRAEFRPGNSLPDEVMEAFQTFRFSVEHLAAQTIIRIQSTLYQSPRLRRFCLRDGQTDEQRADYECVLIRWVLPKSQKRP
jgi:hypothetical protein